MSYSASQIDKILVSARQLLLHYAGANSSINEALTRAACCVYYTEKKVKCDSDGKCYIRTSSNGPTDEAMGEFRRLIHKSNNLNKVNGIFRSGDAELKLLDGLMELPTWKSTNVVVIKVTRKPCKACSFAMSTFRKKYCADGALIVFWPDGHKIFGVISKG